MKLGSTQKRQQLYLIRIGIAVVGVFCILVAISVFKRYEIAKDMNVRRDAVETEKATLVERKLELEDEVEYLEDDRSLEAEIRRNFDVAKAGEQVVIILEDDEKPAMSPIATTTKVTPWYIFWR